MKRLAVRVAPAIVLVLVVAPLVAQQQRGRGFGGGGGGVGALLTNKSVQEELKVTDDQKEKLVSALKEVREKFGKDLQEAFKDKNREKSQEIAKAMSAETNKLVEKTLKPDQVKRLNQIEVQVGLLQGRLDVLKQDRVQKEMQFNDKQRDMINSTVETLAQERQELLKGAGQGGFQEAQKKIAEKAKPSVEKIVESLSSEQKRAWKELTGEKFNYVAEPFRRPQQQ